MDENDLEGMISNTPTTSSAIDTKKYNEIIKLSDEEYKQKSKAISDVKVGLHLKVLFAVPNGIICAAYLKKFGLDYTGVTLALMGIMSYKVPISYFYNRGSEALAKTTEGKKFQDRKVNTMKLYREKIKRLFSDKNYLIDCIKQHPIKSGLYAIISTEVAKLIANDNYESLLYAIPISIASTLAITYYAKSKFENLKNDYLTIEQIEADPQYQKTKQEK